MIYLLINKNGEVFYKGEKLSRTWWAPMDEKRDPEDPQHLQAYVTVCMVTLREAVINLAMRGVHTDYEVLTPDCEVMAEGQICNHTISTVEMFENGRRGWCAN